MAEPVDWPGMMRLGLGLLRLPPDAFWSMTPGEFRRALEGAGVVPAPGGAMDRNRLVALMAAFPDGGAAARIRAGAPSQEGGRLRGSAPQPPFTPNGPRAAQARHRMGERDEHG